MVEDMDVRSGCNVPQPERVIFRGTDDEAPVRAKLASPYRRCMPLESSNQRAGRRIPELECLQRHGEDQLSIRTEPACTATVRQYSQQITSRLIQCLGV